MNEGWRAGRVPALHRSPAKIFSSPRGLVVSKPRTHRSVSRGRQEFQTMRRTMRSRKQGFTLIELMIVIGIIGVLAAIAIPNFMTYQARSRRSEGYTNVTGIARAYKSYQADRDKYPDMVTETTAQGAPAASLPDPAAHGMVAPSTVKMPWDTQTENFFKIVGWKPEGNVFYSYDVKSA